jgi:hypothetical protein
VQSLTRNSEHQRRGCLTLGALALLRAADLALARRLKELSGVRIGPLSNLHLGLLSGLTDLAPGHLLGRRLVASTTHSRSSGSSSTSPYRVLSHPMVTYGIPMKSLSMTSVSAVDSLHALSSSR